MKDDLFGCVVLPYVRLPSLPFRAFMHPFLPFFLLHAHFLVFYGFFPSFIPSPSLPSILSSIPSFSSIYASSFDAFFLFLLSFFFLAYFLPLQAFFSLIPPFIFPSPPSIPSFSSNPPSLFSPSILPSPYETTFPSLDLLLHGPFTKPILRWLRHSSFRK